jgi:HTH-type transcriptional regulator / antitoxin HigA
MSTMKYKIISTEKQYKEYCNILHDLVFADGEKTNDVQDEIDLLTLVIRKWDDEHSNFRKLDPIELIKSLMKDHKLKAKDLATLLDVSKSYISEILNYKKGLSKDVIRKLADRFKLSQEAFNRPYKLKSSVHLKQAS